MWILFLLAGFMLLLSSLPLIGDLIGAPFPGSPGPAKLLRILLAGSAVGAVLPVYLFLFVPVGQFEARQASAGQLPPWGHALVLLAAIPMALWLQQASVFALSSIIVGAGTFLFLYLILLLTKYRDLG